jgi:hypothetical protein
MSNSVDPSAGLVAQHPERERSLPLALLFFGLGAVILAFAYATVHRRTLDELTASSMSEREQSEISYWINHGYFNSGGLLVRFGPTGAPVFYRSATGGTQLSGFVLEKLYSLATGRMSRRLLKLHNEVVVLLTSTLLALLAFRLARRLGAEKFHAFVLAFALQAVYFTFPNNLNEFWELSSRATWLLAACVFLLIEESRGEPPARRTLVAQAVAAFALTYFDYVSGVAFILSYTIVTLLLGRSARELKRFVLVAIVPMLLALGVYRAQIAWVHVQHPQADVQGSDFLFRTGLDGATTYYGTHLDIAYGRKVALANYNEPARPYIFRWKWLFFAGTAAVLAMMLLAISRRVPDAVMLPLLSLLGSYLLLAAMFSQLVVIHPFYFDVMLFTPLMLALLVLCPSMIESVARRRGFVVIAVVFLAAWVSMVHMRLYAMQWPLTTPGQVYRPR